MTELGVEHVDCGNDDGVPNRRWTARPRVRRAIGLGMLVIGIISFTTAASSACSPSVATKIAFNLTVLNEDGLYGPVDGLRARHYEFCIPVGRAFADEVRIIDRTASMSLGSPGRIGCTWSQALVLGHTHQPAFQDVLCRLAGLPYVTRIVASEFE